MSGSKLSVRAKNWGWNATTSLPCWTLRTPSLQQQPLWVSHRENSSSFLCSCPLACVSWLEQADHLGALLLVTVSLFVLFLPEAKF